MIIGPHSLTPDSAAQRRNLAAGGCFAVLMLGALTTAVLLNQRALPDDVLRAMLDKVTSERDALRNELATAPATPAVEVCWSATAVRIRLREPATITVAWRGGGATNAADASHTERTRELLVQRVADGVLVCRALAVDVTDVHVFRVVSASAAAAPESNPPLPTAWPRSAGLDQPACRVVVLPFGSGDDVAQIIIGDADTNDRVPELTIPRAAD
ncbi:MAG: hypothetical protein AB7K09_23470 [Planctomycetota bacterium]